MQKRRGFGTDLPTFKEKRKRYPSYFQHLARSILDVFFTSMASAGACTELLTRGTHLTRPCISTNALSPLGKTSGMSPSTRHFYIRGKILDPRPGSDQGL